MDKCHDKIDDRIWKWMLLQKQHKIQNKNNRYVNVEVYFEDICVHIHVRVTIRLYLPLTITLSPAPEDVDLDSRYNMCDIKHC